MKNITKILFAFAILIGMADCATESVSADDLLSSAQRSARQRHDENDWSLQHQKVKGGDSTIAEQGNTRIIINGDKATVEGNGKIKKHEFLKLLEVTKFFEALMRRFDEKYIRALLDDVLKDGGASDSDSDSEDEDGGKKPHKRK